MKFRYLGLLCLAALIATPLSANAAVLDYEATLEGSQEVPPNPSPATGSATISIDTDANTLTYTIMYSGLVGAETAAHIHGFAAAGANAGVQHPLPAGSPKNGVWNYAEGDEASILAGLTYINIHTSDYPGGEIRGQIVESNSVAVEPTAWSGIKRFLEN